MPTCGTGRSPGPLRGPEARLSGLGQRPDPQGLAARDLLAVEVVAAVALERQPKRLDVQLAAGGRIGRDHRHGREELYVHATSSFGVCWFSDPTRFHQTRRFAAAARSTPSVCSLCVTRALVSAHSETFGFSSRMPVRPRMQGRAQSAAPFIAALPRVTNAVVSRDRLSLTAAADVTRYSSHTAVAR